VLLRILNASLVTIDIIICPLFLYADNLPTVPPSPRFPEVFLYGSTVNLPRWEFGKLHGLYVVLFFLAKVRFDQSPTLPIYIGGSLILIGGGVMAFLKP
jgi:hypothetical protein